MIEQAIERVQKQLTIESVTEEHAPGGVHYLIGCYRQPTDFYAISCSCGWRADTGKSAANAHSMMRAHLAGHDFRDAPDGE